MVKEILNLRIFLSSPSDLNYEREIIEKVVAEYNQIWRDHFGIGCELIRWETSIIPGISTDPQAVINAQIGDNYDIFIGMLWARFGTETKRAGSGTEDEFNIAYDRFRRNPGEIAIAFYMKDAAIPFDDIDITQLERVKSFRSQLSEKGVL